MVLNSSRLILLSPFWERKLINYFQCQSVSQSVSHLVTGGKYPIGLFSIQSCTLTKQRNYKLFISSNIFTLWNSVKSIKPSPLISSLRKAVSTLSSGLFFLRTQQSSCPTCEISDLRQLGAFRGSPLTSLASLSGSFLFLIVFLFVMVFLALEESVRSSNLGKVSKIIE